MDIYGIIYKATNLINGKVYIGQTTRTLEQRKNQHYRDSESNFDYVFYKAIRKYGKENFYWEVIDYAECRDGLNDKEVYWIDFYNSYCKKENSNGYNMTIGGENLSGEYNPFYGKKHSTESKKVMSEKAKGRIMTEETRNKIAETYSNRYSGENSPMYGRKIPEEVKMKMSNAHKGIKKSDEHRINISKSQIGENNSNAKSVIQISLDGEFINEYKTVLEASESVDGQSTHIINCCKGRLKSSSGFIWLYKEDYNEDNVIKKVNEYKNGLTSKKAIYQLSKSGEVIAEYDSISEGAKAVGADRSALAKCCKDRTKTCKGFKWVYKKDFKKLLK